MPPRNSNQAAGKQSAETRTRAHEREVNGKTVKVRSHTRTAQIARSKAAWVGLGFSTLTGIAILLEASVTVAMTIAIIVTAGATTVAVILKPIVEKNRKTLGTQQRRKRPSQRRRSTRQSSARRRRS